MKREAFVSELDRAQSALEHLYAGCPREEWVKIAMAAKAAGLSFDDFHSWSEPAPNYRNEADCSAVWKSIKDTGGIGAGTLFQMAIENGWQDPAKSIQATNERRLIAPIPALRKAPVTPIKRAARFGNASQIWELCVTATTSHPYIANKRGSAAGVRVYPTSAPALTIKGQNVAGYLVVPCTSPEDGALLTLQFIPPDGAKLNLTGGVFDDGYFTVGDIAESRRVFIVEGIGQGWACWQATGDAAVVCFGAGRMLKVAKALRDKYPAARLVLVPDRGKEPQAEAIARDIGGAWAEMPVDKPANFDANDYALEHDTEALGNLLERTKAPPKPEARFKLLSAEDLANTPPLAWMVRGVLPLEGLAALYGPSGSGKSFLFVRAENYPVF